MYARVHRVGMCDSWRKQKTAHRQRNAGNYFVAGRKWRAVFGDKGIGALRRISKLHIHKCTGIVTHTVNTEN